VVIGWTLAGLACVAIVLAAASGGLDALDALRGSPMRKRR
jgi:hypothetical protein